MSPAPLALAGRSQSSATTGTAVAVCIGRGGVSSSLGSSGEILELGDSVSSHMLGLLPISYMGGPFEWSIAMPLTGLGASLSSMVAPAAEGGGKLSPGERSPVGEATLPLEGLAPDLCTPLPLPAELRRRTLCRTIKVFPAWQALCHIGRCVTKYLPFNRGRDCRCLLPSRVTTLVHPWTVRMRWWPSRL